MSSKRSYKFGKNYTDKNFRFAVTVNGSKFGYLIYSRNIKEVYKQLGQIAVSECPHGSGRIAITPMPAEVAWVGV